jgi:hypothetical protein
MFNETYPTLSALIKMFADAAKIATAPGESTAQKIEGEMMVLPQLLAFIPNISKLSAEVAAIKAKPGDIIAAAEMLVTDLAFTNPKSQAIINAVFADIEYMMNGLPLIKTTIAAFQAP